MDLSTLRAANQASTSTRGASQAIGTQKDNINQANGDLAATRDTNAAGRAQKDEKNAKADFSAAKKAAQREVGFTEKSQLADSITSTLTGATNLLKGLLG